MSVKKGKVEADKLDEETQKKNEEKKQKREEESKNKQQEQKDRIERAKENKEKAEEAQRKLLKKKNNPYFYYYVTFGVLGAVSLYVIVMLFMNQSTPLHKVLTIDESKMEEHNNSHPWKQGVNKFFEGTTLSDAKKIFTTTFTSHTNLAKCAAEDSVAVPESFDYRTKWSSCALPVVNQQLNCGSGYAIAIAQTFSERMCISSKAQKLERYSAQELLSCDKNNSGCKGGYLNNASDYLKFTGLVTENCFPYSGEATCDKMCPEPQRVKANNYCILFGEEEIKKDILKNGPVYSAMNLYVDFLTYKSGVYVKGDDVAKFAQHHAIKIVGWGAEKGDENEPNAGNRYWIIQNSWGEDWGENGYAKVSMGQELMFDQYAYSLRVTSDKEEAKKKPEAAKPKAAPAPEAPVEENLSLEDLPDDKGKKTDI